MKLDNAGRRLDCHFYSKTSRGTVCNALVDFYNADDLENLCKDCPFFKTDKEFLDGWRRRNGNDGKLCFTEIS